MEKMEKVVKGTTLVYNLGTGKFTSVWDMIGMMEQVTGIDFMTKV
jgi:UDP-glucose 4-epimerase